MAHLQQLGGGIADPLNFLDIDNSFLHISIMCPDNRATLPLTLTLIFCAVARRLGIAAALCNTPGRIVAVVEGNATTDPGSDTKTRQQFYIDASQEDPVRENLQNFTAEGGAAYNAALASIDWKPASPADLIRRCAHNILNAVQNGRGIPRVIHVHTARARRSREQQGAQESSSDDTVEQQTGTSAPAQEVLKFLSCHPKDHEALFSQGALPASLKRVILSTTASTLPSSRRASPRHEDEEDATYAAAWIMTELSPEELGARGKQWIMGQIESNYPLDVLLCPGGQTEMNKLGMARQRAERQSARRGTSGRVAVRTEEEEDEELEQDLEQDAPSSSASSDSEDFDEGDTDRIFRTHARLLFQNDSLPAEVHSRLLPARSLPSDVSFEQDTSTPISTSSGTARARAEEQAQEQEQEQDPVLHTVGTLMKHRRYGYRAVIVSWDRVCSASSSWIQQMGVDQLEGGGRKQPFYHAVVDDGSRRYVAQCNVVPVRPARSRAGGDGAPRAEGQSTPGSGSDSGSARGPGRGSARLYPQEEGEDIEDFVQVLNVRGIGREFRAADATRCRLRKNARLRAAFPDDESGDEGGDDRGEIEGRIG
jgi:hemimethylated DNA binding protein